MIRDCARAIAWTAIDGDVQYRKRLDGEGGMTLGSSCSPPKIEEAKGYPIQRPPFRRQDT
jgi:hypothetical protein